MADRTRSAHRRKCIYAMAILALVLAALTPAGGASAQSPAPATAAAKAAATPATPATAKSQAAASAKSGAAAAKSTQPAKTETSAKATSPAAPASGAAPARVPAPAAAAATGTPAPASPKPIETGAVKPAATAAAPAAQAPDITKYADWVLECAPIDARKHCSLRQTVADGKGRRIIQLVARRGGNTAFLEVSVPLGISIPYGVFIVLSEKTKLSTELVDCDATGCRAVTPLDEKTLGELAAAKSVSVSFQDSKSGKLLTVGGSLNGFTEGVKLVLASL